MFIIPNPFYIILDDLGWFCGDDDSNSGGPSRTAMPRRHCAEDYIAVNNLGKAIGMKINCGFALSEWDPDNRLLSISNLSKFGKNWNNAAYIDINEIKKCVEIINNSPYIDFSIHALSHGYYAEGVDYVDVSDWYTYIDKKLIMINEDEIRKRLNAFLDLVSYYGITKEINSFIPPSGAYRVNELSKILKDYGIKYITNPFDCTEGLPCPVACIEENGILLSNRNRSVRWNIASANTNNLPADGISTINGKPLYGVFGLHWPNVLHRDSNRNDEVVDRWISYIRRCGEKFTTFIAPDLKSAAHQLLCLSYAETHINDNIITVDLTRLPHINEFYINTKFKPKDYTGCSLKKYAEHQDFATYIVTPTAKTITFKKE